MPIGIITPTDLNALAWHLKQAFNIAKEQKVNNIDSGLYEKRETRFRKDTFKTSFNEALNILMRTVALEQNRKRVFGS